MMRREEFPKLCQKCLIDERVNERREMIVEEDEEDHDLIGVNGKE